MEVPVFCVLPDARVNFLAVPDDAANERVGKQPRLGLPGGRRRQFVGLAPRCRTFFLGDGRRALRVPEFIERPVQILRRIQIVLKQKLHGAFARFAAFAHISIQ